MSSDQEASGSSTAMSPHGSPYSSPLHQIPQLTSFLTKLNCADNVPTTHIRDDKPYLRIIEQPQDHFRFRYRSEMLGTHGCIFGRSHTTNKNKSHPTVELVNYNGPAIITCCLGQHNNSEEHPHQLFEDYRTKDSVELPEKGSYKIAFPDMGVIHNSKNEVKAWLYKKYTEEYRKNGTTFNASQLRAKCDSCVKEIEMNIVRLKFSARDARTGRQICDPVFSDPIHNMKSAATNDLKITKLSRVTGSVNGGDDVIMLCEKVNKKNIKIRLFELKNGVRTWTDMGSFMPTDVHHQYAISFRTPPYVDTKVDKNVQVFIELLRPSDNRTSEPFEFTYLAEKIYKYGKKRRPNSSLSSLTSSSGGSMKSLSELPVTVANHISLNETNENQEKMSMSYQSPSQPNYNMLQAQPYSDGDLLGEALTLALGNTQNVTPMLPNINVGNVPDTVPGYFAQPPPELQITSEDFERLLKSNPHLSEEQKQRLIGEPDWTEYMKALSLEMGDSTEYVGDSGRRYGKTDDYQKSQENKDSKDTSGFRQEVKQGGLCYVADSGPRSGLPKAFPKLRGGFRQEDYEKAQMAKGKEDSTRQEVKQGGSMDNSKPASGLPKGFPRLLGDFRQEDYDKAQMANIDNKVSYAAGDGQEVKQIVKDLVDIMRTKTGYNKQDVRNKLERLFEIRLLNGDTFLHLTVRKNQTSMDYVVKMINAMKMNHLLNNQNKLLQTVLHLAVANDMPQQVEFLVAYGCDPSLVDHEGNTAFHYAVIFNACLESLLKSIKTNKIACDINVRNHDLNTALHLTTLFSSGTGTKLLLANGADYKAMDGQNRTVLHLAAYDGRVEIVKILMEYMDPSDTDILDGRGNTALQIVCGREMTEASVEIVQLLLQNKADPMKEGTNSTLSAWKLCQDKPAIKKIISENMKTFTNVKSEDEYDSADDGQSQESLPELSLYITELSEVLDASSTALYSLAAIMNVDAPFYGDEATSPTNRLLYRIKKIKHGLSSESLAKILKNLGELEAAQIIRRRISE